MFSLDILLYAGAVILGFLGGFFVFGQKKFDEKTVLHKAEKLVSDAHRESKDIIEKSYAHSLEAKKQFDIEQEEFVAQLDKMERMFSAKVNSFAKREAKVRELQKNLKEQENFVDSMRGQISETEKQVSEKLIFKTGSSYQKIKEQLLSEYETNFKSEADNRIQRNIEWAQECAMRDGRNILGETICRFGEATSVEHGHASVIVPKDEIKGRIVGRGGGNIAFFEDMFGVDVVFNDEPNTILIGCFNLVQREVARMAMERLCREKNITEETISGIKPLAEQDVDKILKKEGSNILKLLGLNNMPPDFAKLIGRLKFRTSYGQNIIAHSFEVAYFSRMLASEIGANIEIAWIAGFFHDIGKSIDQEVTGSHDILTKEILEKYGFPKEIVHAAWTHHNAAPIETAEARVVQAADAISAGRPGARSESLERYLAKIKELEETANSFEGVKKAYTINAGREVRVIVEPEKVSDAKTFELASGIAGKVQEKGGYPGKIKITTIRVTKTADYVKK